MQLPFYVQAGDPITADNTNRTIGIVRSLVQKIPSAFPRSRGGGSSYKHPFKVTVEKVKTSSGSTSWTIKSYAGWWRGLGHRYSPKGLQPEYGYNDSEEIQNPWKKPSGYEDIFYIPPCQWENKSFGDGTAYYVILAEPATEHGIVTAHPKIFLSSPISTSDTGESGDLSNGGEDTGEDVSDVAKQIATLGAATVVAKVFGYTSSSDTSDSPTVKVRVRQYLHSDFEYVAENPHANQPFSVYRDPKGASPTTFCCKGGYLRIRAPRFQSYQASITVGVGNDTENSCCGGGDTCNASAFETASVASATGDTEGGCDACTASAFPVSPASAYDDIVGGGGSGDDNTEGSGSGSSGSEGSSSGTVDQSWGDVSDNEKWLYVSDCTVYGPDADNKNAVLVALQVENGDASWETFELTNKSDSSDSGTGTGTSQEPQTGEKVWGPVNFQIGVGGAAGSEWVVDSETLYNGFTFTINLALSAETEYRTYVPIAILRKVGDTKIATVEQIRSGVVDATPLIQFNMNSTTVDNPGCMSPSFNGAADPVSAFSTEEGTNITNDTTGATPAPTAIRASLEAEDLARANSITAAEISSE